jgi:hypothetical protein
MKNKGRSLKRALIINGSYILLLAVLILGLTLAKYRDAMVAYTSFSAASFNALILGDNTIEAMTAEDPVVNEFNDKFTVNVNTVGFRPGMSWDSNSSVSTAKTIVFSIANGTGNDDSSQVDIEYTLKLRTSGNLPLKYTLAEWVPVSSETGGGHYDYYISSAPALINSTEVDTGSWYEYSFLISPSGGEALFGLKGGSLDLTSFKLIMEWPIENGSDNSTSYMKEVELMEVIATVSSKNMLNEYANTDIPAESKVYSSGIIILDPADTAPDGSVYKYTYEIDYRAFAEDNKIAANSRSYTVTVENGIDKQRSQSSDYIHYNLALKVPVFLKDSDSVYAQNYVYTLYSEANPEGYALGTPSYRLYNELDGTYTEYSALPADYTTEEHGSEFRMYAVYQLAAGRTLDNTGEISDIDTYKIAISKPDSSAISDSELNNISFENKLEILAEAIFD